MLKVSCISARGVEVETKTLVNCSTFFEKEDVTADTCFKCNQGIVHYKCKCFSLMKSEREHQPQTLFQKNFKFYHISKTFSEILTFPLARYISIAQKETLYFSFLIIKGFLIVGKTTNPNSKPRLITASSQSSLRVIVDEGCPALEFLQNKGYATHEPFVFLEDINLQIHFRKQSNLRKSQSEKNWHRQK